jgi:hypothetical protein
MSDNAERVQVVQFVRHLMRASQGGSIEWIGRDDVFRTNILRNSYDASRASGIQVSRDLSNGGTTYEISTFISDAHFGHVIISSFEIPGPCEESEGEDIGARLWELIEVVQEHGTSQTVDAMVGVIVERLSGPASKEIESPEGWTPELDAWLWSDGDDDDAGDAEDE